MRGQASLEYLFMYGLVFIIISIVGIALWRAGVFSPMKKEMVLKQPTYFDISSFSMAGHNIVLQLWNYRLGSSAMITKIEVSGGLEGKRSFRKLLSQDSFASFRIPLDKECKVGKLYTLDVKIYYKKESLTGGFSSIEGVDAGRISILCRSDLGYIEPEWLQGFSFRIPVEVRERSGRDLENYSVQIILDTSSLISQGKMKSDCGDLRVTDSDGVTLLDYWIEEDTCNTTQTRIWVRVPRISAYSTKHIYIYYGNSTAISLSNGSSVFLFFDDFSDSSKTNNLWRVNVVDGRVYVDEANGELVINSNYRSYAGLTSTLSLPLSSLVFEAKMKDIDGNTYGNGGIYILDYSPSGDPYNTEEWYRNDFYEYRSQIAAMRYVDGSRENAGYDGEYNEGKYYILGIAIHKESNTVKFFTNYGEYSADTLGFESSDDLYFEVYSYDTGSYRVDWARVRKYTYPEPSVTLGSEERA